MIESSLPLPHKPTILDLTETSRYGFSLFVPTRTKSKEKQRQTPETVAVVYCEGNIGAIDGKTANRLVRHSERR